MERILAKAKEILKNEYGLDVQELKRMTTGVGGDTYQVQTAQGKFIYKIADSNEMNRPEAEPEICEYLLAHGIEVSCFLRNRYGQFVTSYDENRVSHLQSYVEGKVFFTNEAPEWFMRETPVLLGRIHQTLREYPQLPMGIGKEFFQYMTPENARQSYRRSYEKAKQLGETDVLEDLECRMRVTEKMTNWTFETEKLTYCNTHGDYTVNQIICGENKINAVIDWTCACRHPVIWELTRSFFLSEPECAQGGLPEAKFREYVEGYLSVASLTPYDKEHLLNLYLYQLGVCDYYAQYLDAEACKKDEYLQQARFATKVLKNSVL